MRAGPKQFLDPGRRLAVPVGANYQIIAGFSAGGSTPDVTVVEGVAIAEHDGEIALLFHGGGGQNDRVGAKIRPQNGIRRGSVGGDDGRVLLGEDAGLDV